MKDQERHFTSLLIKNPTVKGLMGNITGILSNNFAHVQAVSSRPNCLGLVKEATSPYAHILTKFMTNTCNSQSRAHNDSVVWL